MSEYSVEDRGFRTRCWILPASHSEGYARITVNGRRVYAHRAVLEAVKGPLPPGTEPDHLCRQRACCNPSHLEAVPRKINARRGARAKLSFDDVEAIRVLLLRGMSQRAIAVRFGVSRSRISQIKTGKAWA